MFNEFYYLRKYFISVMIKKMEWMCFMMLLLLLFYYIKNKSLKDMHYSDFTTVDEVLSMFHGWPLMAYCFNKIGIESNQTRIMH